MFSLGIIENRVYIGDSLSLQIEKQISSAKKMWFSFGGRRVVQICFLALYIFTGKSLKYGESIIEKLFVIHTVAEWHKSNTDSILGLFLHGHNNV